MPLRTQRKNFHTRPTFLHSKHVENLRCLQLCLQKPTSSAPQRRADDILLFTNKQKATAAHRSIRRHVLSSIFPVQLWERQRVKRAQLKEQVAPRGESGPHMCTFERLPTFNKCVFCVNFCPIMDCYLPMVDGSSTKAGVLSLHSANGAGQSNKVDSRG